MKLQQDPRYNVGTINLKIMDFSKSEIKTPADCQSYEITLNCGDLFTINLQSEAIGNLINLFESQGMSGSN